VGYSLTYSTPYERNNTFKTKKTRKNLQTWEFIPAKSKLDLCFL